MSRRLAGALALAALLAGCSQYERFDSVAHLRGQYAQRVGAAAAAQLQVPFELDGTIRAALPAQRHHSPDRRIAEVMDLIFEKLRITYQLSPTRSAVEAFRTQRGNCLSFVNLFVGIARASDLNPFYVEVTDYQRWSHQAGMVVSQGHIVAGMYLSGELQTYDFLPYRPKAYRNFNPIDDLQAAAHYYNNLGAEALLGGDAQEARRLIEIAASIAPDFPKALNNLGVVRARAGDSEGAQEAYRRALAVEPENSIVMTNMARLLQLAGRGADAERMLAQVEAANTSNPYFFIYQSDVSLSRGDHRKALDYMSKAMRLDTESADVHVGLVRVYLALGDSDKARHHLARALALDTTNVEAQRFAVMLGR